MSEYRPYQHVARPQGCSHTTIFASVELWIDNPPDVLVFGDYRYILERDEKKMTKDIDI